MKSQSIDFGRHISRTTNKIEFNTDSSDAVCHGSVIANANYSYLVSLGEGCHRFPSRD